MMRGKNLLISSIGIFVLICAIILMAWLLKQPDSYVPLILDSIAIRDVGNNSLEKARVIDDMDKNIGRIKEDSILAKWDVLTNCLNDGCPDDDLFDFILAIVIAKSDKILHSKLIADVIVAGRFWGSGEILQFSKSVTSANEAIAVLKIKEIDKKWDQIVACDGVCAEKYDLIFDEVKLIIEKGNLS